MNLDAIKASYRRYAGIYDVVFGKLLMAGRRKTVEALRLRPGERILEVGVGTGLSLPLYPSDVTVVGIDISEEMLAKAREKVERQGLSQVEALLEMDAEKMTFPDRSFDKVVAMYVTTVVPHPDRFINEMRRVCKEDGEICIVNHFRATHPVMNAVEALVRPFSKVVGFRPDLEMAPFVRDNGLDVQEIQKTDILGHWKLLRCKNNPPPVLSKKVPLGAVPEGLRR